MSIIELPHEIFRLIDSYADLHSRFNLRSTSRYLSQVNKYLESEQIDLTKNYSDYYSIGEAILDYREFDHSELMNNMVTPSIKFLEENVENIGRIIVKIDECSYRSFEFIAKIFETTKIKIRDLQLDLWFSKKETTEIEGYSFISGFSNMRFLSLILTHTKGNHLDFVFEDLQNTTFKDLKNVELAIRCTSVTDEQVKKLEELIEKLKPLKHLTLDIKYSSDQSHLDNLIESLANIPFLNLNFDTSLQTDSLTSISEQCKCLVLKYANTSHTHKFPRFELIDSLSRVEIDSTSSILFSTQLKELKLGSYTSEPNHVTQSDVFKKNSFQNLVRLELIEWGGNSMNGVPSLPSLEYVYCRDCSFHCSIDFFSASPKLKSLILKYCYFSTPARSEFKCKELVELEITTTVPLSFLDPLYLSGLKLKKLIINPHNPKTNWSTQAIEDMTSLEYLDLGDYFDSFNFSKLTNLKYLEYRSLPTELGPHLFTNHLLHNCVIYSNNVSNHDSAVPTFSIDQSLKTTPSFYKKVVNQLETLNCKVKGISFLIISEEYIYVAFSMQSRKRVSDSYPSFLLLKNMYPYSIQSSGRSYDLKQDLKIVTIDSLMLNKNTGITYSRPHKNTNKCDVQ